MKNDLSPRELSVLELATQGFTDDMIGEHLSIESGTVNSYWVRIRSKMGNLSRTELVARFVQKNADRALIDQRSKHEQESEANASASKALLDEAHREIDRLKSLLARDKTK